MAILQLVKIIHTGNVDGPTQNYNGWLELSVEFVLEEA